MTFSASRLAFADCFKLFDDAIASEKGIKFRVKSRKHAYHYRNRLNHARRLDRKDNYETFADPSHPLHGRSIYDGLTVVMLFDEGWWLMVEKLESREFEIQAITGEENNVEQELYNGGGREAAIAEATQNHDITETAPVNSPAVPEAVPVRPSGLRRI